MSHTWIIRFLEHRIADKRILRLIAKWLKVGIIEDGRVEAGHADRRQNPGDLVAVH
jgi:retron-type reverse transcriptase